MKRLTFLSIVLTFSSITFGTERAQSVSGWHVANNSYHSLKTPTFKDKISQTLGNTLLGGLVGGTFWGFIGGLVGCKAAVMQKDSSHISSNAFWGMKYGALAFSCLACYNNYSSYDSDHQKRYEALCETSNAFKKITNSDVNHRSIYLRGVKVAGGEGIEVPINARDPRNGWTALHHAIYNGKDLELIKSLLAHKADLSLKVRIKTGKEKRLKDQTIEDEDMNYERFVHLVCSMNKNRDIITMFDDIFAKRKKIEEAMTECIARVNRAVLHDDFKNLHKERAEYQRLSAQRETVQLDYVDNKSKEQ